jgi:hypothetical protein
VFAEILGEMLYHGSAEQICFGSGVNLLHPQPPLAALAAFEMPQDLMEGRGYPEVTDDMKRLIIGGNIARVHDIDPSTIAARIAGDEFEVAKRNGLRPPWSGLRESKEAITV